jgi:hypothetical protein
MGALHTRQHIGSAIVSKINFYVFIGLFFCLFVFFSQIAIIGIKQTYSYLWTIKK